ncbi:sensor histidine kinase [Sorangium cellulosum]|uniref:histidine kinase n=1 Tax=Sorangium cellulosum TaxID=56 RepID=A0A4P2Q8L0_SORCE|nr:ATP-binding protein [Sorangium cellulosum]AUX25875.1 sensor histidine kinase [Sorangium cellulosum]
MSERTAERLGEPPASAAPVTLRKPLTRDIPLDWLDDLLLAASELEPSASIEQRASALLGAAAKALVGCGLGVHIPGAAGAPVVIRLSPRAHADDGYDPARLFPELSFERVLTITPEDRSTVHVATDDSGYLDSAPLVALLDRLVLTLRASIREARAQQTLREQVIQAEKLASLGKIAAGVVHELNNPLTSILAYSEYLRRKGERSGFDPSDLERLARINEAADRILRFSRDLIAYSRPSSEKPGAVSLHDIIERALIFCEHLFEQTGVTVEKRFGDIPAARGVIGPLTQVFVNLFTNAAHAMHENGGCLSITTAVSPDDDHIAVTIRDDGHGIAPHHLPRIFDPFFTTKTDGTGTGLGLSIVRNIVASHGGTIRAAARAPRGTTFYLDLPIALPSSARR